MAILESIRKRPLSKRLLDISYGGCAILLMGFMLFITGFDVKALFWGEDSRPGMEQKVEAPEF
jgi:regulator of sigma E protease